MSDNYVRGEMDIKVQESTWTGFMKVSLWTCFLLVLALGYAIFTLTPMAVNWMVALGLFTIVGIVGGLMMKMGNAWTVTVIGLAVFAVFLQIIIMLAQAVI